MKIVIDWWVANNISSWEYRLKDGQEFITNMPCKPFWIFSRLGSEDWLSLSPDVAPTLCYTIIKYGRRGMVLSGGKNKLKNKFKKEIIKWLSVDNEQGTQMERKNKWKKRLKRKKKENNIKKKKLKKREMKERTKKRKNGVSK